MARFLLYAALAFLLYRLVQHLRQRGLTLSTKPAERPAWDPYAVLKVERGASADEIKNAYHEQMRQYHPDRVATLGPELQALAHQKALEIQRAYRELAP